MKKQLFIILIIIIGINNITVFGSEGKGVISYNLQQIYPSHELYDEYKDLKRERLRILSIGVDSDWKFYKFEKNMKANSEEILRFIKFNNTKELQKFLADLVEISSGFGKVNIGEREFSYYIGDPDGTIYNPKEEVKAIKNDNFYYYDIDKDGDVIMYLWEGNESLDEMSSVGFLKVLKLKYAMTVGLMDDYYYSYSDYIKVIGIPSDYIRNAGISSNDVKSNLYVLKECLISPLFILPAILMTAISTTALFINLEKEDETENIEIPNNEDTTDKK